MKSMKRTIALAVAIAMIFGCVIGGTVAWLIDSTGEVKNTFTVGNIDITLAETKADFEMVPGNQIDKDPKVTVKGGSEACYVFVEMTESTNLDQFITYTPAEGWTELQTGVYYREVAASDNDQAFSVLANDKVAVNTTVTKNMMDGLAAPNAEQPTLTFKAYAVQKDNLTVAQAWAQVGQATWNTDTGANNGVKAEPSTGA